MDDDCGYSADQQAFAESIVGACRKQLPALSDLDAAAFHRGSWVALAELGVLSLTSPDTGATALDVVAACEAVGYAGCPGPVWQTLLALPVLDDATRERIERGEGPVAVGRPEWVAWPRDAIAAIELGDFDLAGWRAWEATIEAYEEEWVSLGHEPVAATRMVRRRELLVTLPDALRARLAIAAYLTGAGRRVLDDVVGYVDQRTQFGQRLGSLAAVADPLAECEAWLRAGGGLTRRAASVIDTEAPPADGLAAVNIALRATAKAARDTVYQAHQAYGAIGFTTEGPLSWLGQRVAQLATEAEAFSRDTAWEPLSAPAR